MAVTHMRGLITSLVCGCIVIGAMIQYFQHIQQRPEKCLKWSVEILPNKKLCINGREILLKDIERRFHKNMTELGRNIYLRCEEDCAGSEICEIMYKMSYFADSVTFENNGKFVRCFIEDPFHLYHHEILNNMPTNTIVVGVDQIKCSIRETTDIISELRMQEKRSYDNWKQGTSIIPPNLVVCSFEELKVALTNMLRGKVRPGVCINFSETCRYKQLLEIQMICHDFGVKFIYLMYACRAEGLYQDTGLGAINDAAALR